MPKKPKCIHIENYLNKRIAYEMKRAYISTEFYCQKPTMGDGGKRKRY